MDEFEALQHQIIAETAAKDAYKQQQIEERLPSWSAVSDAVDTAFTNADQRTLIKHLCRVVYWLAKNQKE